MLFVPVWFKDIMLDVLFGIGKLGDIYELDSETFFKKDKLTQGLKTRFWTKCTLYEEQNQVFQSAPLSAAIFSVSPLNFLLFIPLTFPSLLYVSSQLPRH